MKLTRRDLAKQANQVGGTLEEMRWKLARLAARAKREGIQDWAKVIGNCRAVRRSVRTAEDWALTAEFCDDLPRQYNLPYSFFSVARRYADKMAEGDLIDMLDTAEQDRTINLEAFGASLKEVLPSKPEPAVPSLRDTLLQIGETLKDTLTKIPDGTFGIRPRVFNAYELIGEAISEIDLQARADASEREGELAELQEATP